MARAPINGQPLTYNFLFPLPGPFEATSSVPPDKIRPLHRWAEVWYFPPLCYSQEKEHLTSARVSAPVR